MWAGKPGTVPDLEWQWCKCGAGWWGYWHEACDWCYQRKQVELARYRQELLYPDELMPGTSLRYEELSEIDQAVWRATRGIAAQGNEYQPQREWLQKLAQAVTDEVITPSEMMAAFKRVFIRGTRRSSEDT